MVLAKIFNPFIENSPVSVMVRGSMERLLSATWVDRVFEESAEGQYTRDLLFSSVFGLMCQVVLGRRKSIHAAYMPQMDEIGVSVTSVYNKINGVTPTTGPPGSFNMLTDQEAQMINPPSRNFPLCYSFISVSSFQFDGPGGGGSSTGGRCSAGTAKGFAFPILVVVVLFGIGVTRRMVFPPAR